MILESEQEYLERLTNQVSAICNCDCGCNKNLTNGSHRCTRCQFNECGRNE